jgi:polyhydroxybutyrate depolymerase
MKYFISIIFLLCKVLCLFAEEIEGTITVDNAERNYILYLPNGYTSEGSYPLVIVLHGGGGEAKGIMKMTGFNDIADKERFIAVYPDGQDKQWRDGRIGDKLPKKYDDVKFISNLIDTLSAEYSINTKRVFATGISNGGFMSFYLAYKLSEKILAVAPVCANIPENLKDEYKLSNPVSLLLINGTEDKLVKYDGGKVGFGKIISGRGNSLSTDETISIWKKQLGCYSTQIKLDIADTDKDDDCYAEQYIYSGCQNNTQLMLIKVVSGGHTWPSGPQYLPKTIVGNVCRDFDASEMIWNFFKSVKARE